MVGMSDAVAVAEKEYKAKTYRANLRNSGQYGLVWDVHMVKEDETHVRAYVDAKTGKVVADCPMAGGFRHPGFHGYHHW